jgi:choice-of-anchor B domain-containing protein
MRRFYHPVGLLFILVMTAIPAAAQTATTAGDAEAMQGFGAVVAISGGDVLIGEPTNFFRPGMVYVYRKNADGYWAEAASLSAPEGALRDRFGRAIAVQGNTMLVSAIAADGESPGTVYTYQRSGDGDWRLTGQLQPSDGAAGDRFGSALVAGEGFAMVGAPYHADTTGAVYLFTRSGSDWTQVAKLTVADAEQGDRFGSAIAMAGDHVMIGAPGRKEAAGMVAHFHRTAEGFVEAGQFDPGRRMDGARFGAAIAMTEWAFYVGMPQANDRMGALAAYRFDAEAGEWQESGRLVPFDSRRRSAFGSSVALSEGGLWVGAPGASTIHAFTMGDDGWSGVSRILPEDLRNSRSFGGAMAIGDGVAVIGISGADGGAGTAMIMERGESGWMAATTVASEAEAMEEITGGQVDCEDGEVASWTCNGVDLVSFLPVSAIGGGRGIRLNDIWGWTDPQTGREYALIGRIDGTSFVDMTDPLYPRYVGDLPKTAESPMSVWRDIKVYENHAYIVADGAGFHGMQVLDLAELRKVGPGDDPVTFTETVHYDEIASAHNIVINEATGFAYAVGSSRGGTTCGGGLHMIDIREPANPTFVGCVADVETGRRKTGYSHDAQCVIYSGPDQDYQGREICIGSNETALSFADVTDKDNPVLISNMTYPNVAYAHQGWLSEDQRFFFSNDEGDEPSGLVPNTRTLVWDVSDLDDPVLLTEYFAETTETDHNLYVRGNFMYQSNYGAGLRIIDISDPENLVEVGYFDTAPDTIGCCGSWSNYPYFESGVIPVTGGNAGVFFVRKHEAPVP